MKTLQTKTSKQISVLSYTGFVGVRKIESETSYSVVIEIPFVNKDTCEVFAAEIADRGNLE